MDDAQRTFVGVVASAAEGLAEVAVVVLQTQGDDERSAQCVTRFEQQRLVELRVRRLSHRLGLPFTVDTPIVR